MSVPFATVEARSPIIETDARAIVLDLSTGATLRGVPVDGLDVESLSRLIDEELAENRTRFAFGRYLEPRGLYGTEHFAGSDGERRTVHLGLDLFCRAGTAIHAPQDGRIAFVANNDRELDYGPLLILEHAAAGGGQFFTLYGHLGADVLRQRRAGDAVRAGEQVATVGAPPGNGNWPPHLHFQVIRDLSGLDTEFPGVAAASELDYWTDLSPHPGEFFPEIDPERLVYRACN